MIFNLEPYVGIGPLRFGMSQDQVKSIVGEPERILTNRRGEPDFQYSGINIRFSSEELRLVELGIYPSTSLTVMGVSVFDEPDAFSKIVELDGQVFECYGFIIFFGLGVTMTGFHDEDGSQKAVTLFARGRWDHLREQMQPFMLQNKSWRPQ